jgi:hypothetical protein
MAGQSRDMADFRDRFFAVFRQGDSSQKTLLLCTLGMNLLIQEPRRFAGTSPETAPAVRVIPAPTCSSLAIASGVKPEARPSGPQVDLPDLW